MRSLSGDVGDVLLELDCIQINERLECELWVHNVKVCVDQVLNLLPVVLLQVVITKGHHNRHSTLEGVYKLLQFLLDWVLFEVLFKSQADLAVIIGLSRDFLCLDGVELGLNPCLLQILPLIK